ncbi:hypothetical protein PV433_18350 [Paenibacillus sp. GYB004]|uniref:hypothetical protein n=1 Tax=Paenibacillus sp. GYB004 TaxID=2994393 RepID=UPI002F96B28E
MGTAIESQYLELENGANAKLIAIAPETTEFLLGEVERQAEEIDRLQKRVQTLETDYANDIGEFGQESKRLRKALQFYGDENNYHRRQKDAVFFYPAPIEDDLGQKAREALKEGE